MALTLAMAAACAVVVLGLRVKSKERIAPTSPPLPRGSAAKRLTDTAARSLSAASVVLKINVALAALLAVSTIAGGTMVAVALPSGAGTSSTTPAVSVVKQFSIGDVRAAGRTPGEGSLNFGALATQTEAHRPTFTATPTPTLTPTATPDPTATPTPPPPFVWPADGWISGPLSATHPGGIDIAVNTGEPVHSVRAGRVAFAGGDPCCSYGYYIIVEHDDGWTSLYGHLSSFAVFAGASVEQGQLIGLSGETGKARGAHLHFELRSGGVPVNPIDYLPPR